MLIKKAHDISKKEIANRWNESEEIIESEIENDMIAIEEKEKSNAPSIVEVENWEALSDEELNKSLENSDGNETGEFLASLNEVQTEEVLSKNTILLKESFIYEMEEAALNGDEVMAKEPEKMKYYEKVLKDYKEEQEEKTKTVSSRATTNTNKKNGWFFITLLGDGKTTKIRIDTTLTEAYAPKKQGKVKKVTITPESNNHNVALSSYHSALQLDGGNSGTYGVFACKLSYTKSPHVYGTEGAAVGLANDSIGRFNFRDYHRNNSLPDTSNNGGHLLTPGTQTLSIQIFTPHMGFRPSKKDGSYAHASKILLFRPYKNKLTVNPNGGTWQGSGAIQVFEENGGVTKQIPNPVPAVGVNVNFNGNGGTAQKENIRATKSFTNWSKTGIGGGTLNGTTYTYCAGTNAPITPITQNVLTANYKNNAIQLPNAIREDYMFQGWYTSPTGGSLVGKAGESYTPSSEITLYAQWESTKYNLTVNPNGGEWKENSNQQTITIAYNNTIEIPIPTKKGSTFVGWTLIGNGSSITSLTENATFTMGNQNATLTANWIVNRSTLEVNPNGGKWNGTFSHTIFSNQEYNTKIDIPEPTWETQWQITFDGNGGTPEKANMSTKKQFSRWIKSTNFNGNLTNTNYTFGEKNGATDIITAQYNNPKIKLPNATKEGYFFKGWYSSPDSEADRIGLAGEEYEVTQTTTLYAQWEANQVQGIKIWNDFDNAEGTRPDSYTLQLYANGEYVKQETFKGETWLFSDLEKNTSEVMYTVKEIEVPGYETIYAGNNVIINHLKTNATVKIVKKEEESEKLLQNAQFEIFKVNEDETLTSTKNTVTTDAKGEAYVNLPIGEYALKEIKAPDGYILSDETFYFNIEDIEAGSVVITYQKELGKVEGIATIKDIVFNQVEGGSYKGGYLEVGQTNQRYAYIAEYNRNGGN